MIEDGIIEKRKTPPKIVSIDANMSSSEENLMTPMSVDNVVRRAKRDITDVLRMLDSSNKMRSSLDTELKEMKDVLHQTRDKSTHTIFQLQHELEKANTQISIEKVENARLADARNKLQDEVKRVLEELEHLKTADKSRIKKQVETAGIKAQSDEEKNALVREKKVLQIQLEELHEIVEERDQAIENQAKLFKLEETYLKEQVGKKEEQITYLAGEVTKYKDKYRKLKSKRKGKKEGEISPMQSKLSETL